MHRTYIVPNIFRRIKWHNPDRRAAAAGEFIGKDIEKFYTATETFAQLTALVSSNQNLKPLY